VARDHPQLSKLTRFRSRCPLASVLDLIGDKWSLLVLRDLYLGKRLFSEFEESWEGISPAVLSDRLKAIENMGLVKRSLYSERPLRAEYRLTLLGDSLVKSILPLAEWGHTHIAGRYPVPERDIFKRTSTGKS